MPHLLGRPMYLVRRQAEDLAEFYHGGASVIRIRAADHSHAVVAPSLVHPANDFFAAVPRQIEIDVCQLAELGPLHVDEAVEGQVEAERAGVADAECVAHQRVCRRPAGQRVNVVAAAVFHNFVKHEEVVGVVDFLDDVQLVLDTLHDLFPLRAHAADAALRRLVDVAPPAPGDRQLPQVLDCCRALRCDVLREAVLREIESEIALLGDGQRVFKCVGSAGEEALHFVRRTQVPQTVRLVGVRLIEQRQRADRRQRPQ